MFIENLEKICETKNITIAKMTSDLGLAVGIVSNWRKRGTLPSGEVILKIADYFDCSIDYLFGRENTLNHTEKQSVRYIGGQEISTARKNAKRLYEEHDEMRIDYIEEKTHANYATFRLWLDGRGDFFNDKLSVIADMFGVSVDYLIGCDDEEYENSQMMKNYLLLDSMDKAEIKGTIKQMLKADKYSVKTNLSDYAELAAEGGTETRGRKKKKVEILE